ncbi:MAG: response regulator transcription factor [Rhizobiaceae bacterium]
MLHDKFSETGSIPAGPALSERIISADKILVSTSAPLITSYISGKIKARHPGVPCDTETVIPNGNPIRIYQSAIAIVDEEQWRQLAGEPSLSSGRFHAFIVICDRDSSEAATSGSGNTIALVKPDIEELMQALGHILSGRDPRSFKGRKRDPISVANQRYTPRPAFTKREGEVFAGILEGLRYKQIAASLGISEATVKVHAYRIFDKTGVSSKHRLVSNYHAGC